MDNQQYRNAKFLISAGFPSQFPAGGGIEVAFAGRSNAGKSSAINALCDNKNVSKTSKTPGRTRLINFFTIDEKRRIVDLPGYGYAKVSEKMRLEWEQLLDRYLHEQKALKGLVIIMDIRHPLKEFDYQMLSWCKHFDLAAHIILTKADKLKKGPQQASLLQVEKQLEKSGFIADVQIFSATKKTGLDTLIQKLNHWFEFTDT